MQDTTICAIASSPGTGAIATLRLSGNEAITITSKIFRSPKKNKQLSEQLANTIHFGIIFDGEEDIDEVVVTLFHAPHSFTGEEVVEISCHGSVYIQQRILQLLIDRGAVMAQPGEFTQRAFLNGKMDLSQAEAVADLIASSNAANHRMALKQMRGGFSQEIAALRERMLHFMAMVELELDFSEEDVEFANRQELLKLCTEIEAHISGLADSFKLGNALKNGVPVAIVGETNAGKSTLLNALLKEEKAIVSDIHGTTRDVIEDVININGTSFRFFDTAGLRDTEDEIEKIGIERSYTKLSQAEMVLLVVDFTKSIAEITVHIENIRARINEQQLLIVANKTDRVTREKLSSFMLDLSLAHNEHLVFISAKEKQNLSELENLLLENSPLNQSEGNDIIVNNIRHYEALKNAQTAIRRVLDGLALGISGDFLAQDIREANHTLQEVTGEAVHDEEVLGHIFSRFCIGK
ncbi:MAG: tRNA uridine-5-carboxymethylaminomethyl(34) synthesis GTPase MnmE [Mangrovibacterium sp.]